MRSRSARLRRAHHGLAFGCGEDVSEPCSLPLAIKLVGRSRAGRARTLIEARMACVAFQRPTDSTSHGNALFLPHSAARAARIFSRRHSTPPDVRRCDVSSAAQAKSGLVPKLSAGLHFAEPRAYAGSCKTQQSVSARVHGDQAVSNGATNRTRKRYTAKLESATRNVQMQHSSQSPKTRTRTSAAAPMNCEISGISSLSPKGCTRSDRGLKRGASGALAWALHARDKYGRIGSAICCAKPQRGVWRDVLGRRGTKGSVNAATT
jgi:hypothetical protein